MTLSILPDDIHHIIYRFLGPRETVSVYTLSDRFHKLVKIFLMNTLQTTRLLRSVCPMCGIQWIDPFDPVEIGMAFMEIVPMQEVYRRYRYVKQLCDTRDRFLLKRAHLLCRECEGIHMTIQDTHDYVLHRFCNYTIHVEYYTNFPWVFIMSDSPYGVRWNEYRCTPYKNLSM